MDMRGYIAQRLDEMKSPHEKNLLRDVLEDIFIPLYDHVEGQYVRLENRVKEQMPIKASSFVLWTCLMERENAAGGCPYLYPMLEEDLRQPTIEMHGLRERLKSEREIRLDTVFIQADYLPCKEIEDGREIYDGVLKTENGDFRAGIRLRRSTRYSACVENLYRLFISNGIPWQTINAPYIFKMFDVMLVRLESDGKDEAGSVSGYETTFGKYAGYIKRGLLPVWNVRMKRMKGEDFPLPALDKVNYEYAFDLTEDGVENGYLADYGSADISAVRREENRLIVTSPMQKGLLWDMYKVMRRKDYITDYFAYELMNNAQEESFAARMVAYYGIVVKTGAELRRILSAYDVSDSIELDAVQVVPDHVSGETYEVNDFLTDEIRDLAVSKSLLLTFKSLKRHSFILRDMMSFLVSQTQLIYPEFHCVGVLI